ASDPVRAVRVNAAWGLRGIDLAELTPEHRSSVQAAFADWKTFAAIGSDEPESHHNMGIFLSAQGEGAEAEAAYRRAITLEPRAVGPRHNLAMLLIAMGRIDMARTELDALVAIDPGFAAAWYALGMIHGEESRWPEAVRALSACLKADPLYPRALTDITHAYLNAGVPNVARVVLMSAIQHEQTKREALAGLVRVAVASGDRSEARGWAAELSRADPAATKNPLVAELLAESPTTP
ncbi:MAG TPA: tetratricopeptide repeat protein, partial [Terriglobales bacterium]|nr:tetratricopeptide repeat protein [Terriglobales bacterium]